MSRWVLAGGSGLVGRKIQALASSAGKEVVVLSRGDRGIRWDGQTLGPWVEQLEGAEAVLNLSGETIAQKWTPEARKRILDSRVMTTRVLAQAISQCERPPAVWINASATGIYGDRGDEVLTESSAIGPAGEFLVDTCVQWEKAVEAFPTPVTRKVILRLGVVLDRAGGMLPVLEKLTKVFAGGAAGSGQQYVSWIHAEDLANLFAWCAGGKGEGMYHAVGPNPARNAELMAELRAKLGRPWSPPAPSWAIQAVGALAGPAPDLILQSQRAIPARAQAEGFSWRFPDLKSALANLLSEGKS